MQSCLIKTKKIIQWIQVKQNIDYKKSPFTIRVELNLCNAFKQILNIQEHIEMTNFAYSEQNLLFQYVPLI